MHAIIYIILYLYIILLLFFLFYISYIDKKIGKPGKENFKKKFEARTLAARTCDLTVAFN